jgi:hypothetical protein
LAKNIPHLSSGTLSVTRLVKYCVYLRQIAIETGGTLRFKKKIYKSTMSVSPLLSPEIVAELMEHLRLDWATTKKKEYRFELEQNWSPPHSSIKNMFELESIQNPQH